MVSRPTFSIRRHASRLIPLEDYVKSRVMTRQQADVIRNAIASRLLETVRTSIREIEQYNRYCLVDPPHGREAEDEQGFGLVRYDELVQITRFCVTGENHPVRLPDVPIYREWLAAAEYRLSHSPMVDGRYLAVVPFDGLALGERACGGRRNARLTS